MLIQKSKHADCRRMALLFCIRISTIPRLHFQVEAEANTDTNPIEGFVPRRGAGLALFGKSSSEPPARKVFHLDIYHCNCNVSPLQAIHTKDKHP